MTHVLHRSLKASYPEAVAGDGPYLIDAGGKRYLDASGGAAVSCLGHSDREVIEAVRAQMDVLPYAHTGVFTNRPLEDLADFLAEAAPDPLNWVYPVCGGSEANEAAIKLARQYFVETGRPERHVVIARDQSYHGNTLGALSVGGNYGRRKPYEPLLIDFAHIPPCYAYRGRAAGETEEAYGRRVADALEETILEIGPDQVMAFMAETVVGATLGAVPAVAGYFARIREICNKYEVVLILDEVMCGMGRTGTLFAFEQEGIVPDIVTVAKGLGAGYQPIGAMIAADFIVEAIRDGAGAFEHGHTYIGHPAACAAALATQRKIRDAGLLANVRAMGALLTEALHRRFDTHPCVGDIRGRGLFIGLELVADKATRQPLDPALKLPARLKAAALDLGLMIYPGAGTADGVRGDHILLAPPYIVDEALVHEIVDRLGRALDRVLPVESEDAA